MFGIFRVLLDGSTCPCKSPAARRPNGIFRENLRQHVCELTIKCSDVGPGTHDLPPTWGTPALPSDRSSAMLVRDSRTSSANGAFGRHERQDSAGMRLVTPASG